MGLSNKELGKIDGGCSMVDVCLLYDWRIWSAATAAIRSGRGGYSHETIVFRRARRVSPRPPRSLIRPSH
jgi:hypothetical protein